MAAMHLQCDHNNSAVAYDTIHESACTDNKYQELDHISQHGFPDHKVDLPHSLTEFWNMREDLYVIDGLAFVEGRVLIPHTLHHPLIDELHLGHEGINSMKSNAQRCFFWPGMGTQLQNCCDQCC